jgi:cullin 3
MPTREEECPLIARGFQFTQKLEGMFTDMRISAEGANTFRNYLNRHGVCHLLFSPESSFANFQALPLDLQVSVLTTSHWPPSVIATSPLIFPAPLTNTTSVFQAYYDSRHSGRRLTWQGNLGTADVKVRFKTRSHDVNCSTQALVVMLAFEDVRGEETLGYSVSLLLGSE